MWTSKATVTIVPDNRALFLNGSPEATKELKGVVKFNLRKETLFTGLVVVLRGEETFRIRKTGKKNKTESFLLEEHLRTGRFTLPKGETEIPFTLRLRQDMRDSIAKFASSSNFTGTHKHYLDYFLSVTAHGPTTRTDQVDLFITQSVPAPARSGTKADKTPTQEAVRELSGFRFTFVAPTSVRAGSEFSVRVYPNRSVKPIAGFVSLVRDTYSQVHGTNSSQTMSSIIDPNYLVYVADSSRAGSVGYYLIRFPGPATEMLPSSQTVRDQPVTVTYTATGNFSFVLPTREADLGMVRANFEIEVLPPLKGIFPHRR